MPIYMRMYQKIFLAIYVFIFSVLSGDFDFKAMYAEALKVNRSERAFQGAEGFGAFSQGGRGGSRLIVTTLEDTGEEGSLRWALERDYPRLVEFAVSGVIVLKGKLSIKNPFITIDGATAPGNGITLKDGALAVEETHDIIIRYIKARPGDEAILHKGVWAGSSRKASSMDALTVRDSAFVIIDHCSATWGSDECLSVTDSRNVTISHCLIAEPLGNPDLHDGEYHPYGSLANGDGISFIKNLVAFFKIRAPQMGYEGHDIGDTSRRKEAINNLICAYSHPATRMSVANPITLMQVIKNVYERPLSSSGVAINIRYGEDLSHDNIKARIFLSGNRGPGFADGQWLGIKSDISDEDFATVRAQNPLFPSDMVIWAPKYVKNKVLKNVGALLPVRDGIDLRILQHVLDGTGDIITSQDDVGGYIY